MPRRTTQAIKTRQNKLTRRLKKLPSIEHAFFLLLGGLLLGTVFIFLVRHTQGPVSIEEARTVTAVMQDVRDTYSSHRGRRRLTRILIRFEDYEQLSIDAPVADRAILDKLLSVPSGTTFDMLIHPNSTMILDLTIDGEEIVRFDEAMAKLNSETQGFFWMGMLLYTVATYGLFTIAIRLKLRRY